MKVRLPQGMGGGPQNMNAMIRQAQKMQEECGYPQKGKYLVDVGKYRKKQFQRALQQQKRHEKEGHFENGKCDAEKRGVHVCSSEAGLCCARPVCSEFGFSSPVRSLRVRLPDRGGAPGNARRGICRVPWATAPCSCGSRGARVGIRAEAPPSPAA